MSLQSSCAAKLLHYFRNLPRRVASDVLTLDWHDSRKPAQISSSLTKRSKPGYACKMELSRVHSLVGTTPHMSYRQAKIITSFIREHDLTDILELGFRYGVSTAYMAATLEDLGRGHITAIDLKIVEHANPGVSTFVEELGLQHRVTAHYEPTSYVWRLMRMLEDDPAPRFDFCYLDGAHDWFVDGFAFFLVDRLLRPGGWIIFDDVDWTFGTSPTLAESERVRAMPADERETAQVRKVVDLLVRPHPGYSEVTIKNDWAFVQKSTLERRPQEVSTVHDRATRLAERLRRMATRHP